MVPDEYISVWRRSLYTTKRGVHDTTTHVFWMQTRCFHADLRIPQPTPASSTSSLEDCSDEDLLELAGQTAFAGTTQVEGDIATWNRLIDYEPPGEPDVGRMTWVSPNVLHEDDPSASQRYHETWERVPGTTGPDGCWECALLAADNPGRAAFLLCAGDRFMFAADRPSPLPTPAGGLKELVGQCASREEKFSLLRFEVSYGCVDGWRIELSTLPGRVGQSVMHSVGTLSEVKASLTGVNRALRVGAYCPEGGWHCAA